MAPQPHARGSGGFLERGGEEQKSSSGWDKAFPLVCHRSAKSS